MFKDVISFGSLVFVVDRRRGEGHKKENREMKKLFHPSHFPPHRNILFRCWLFCYFRRKFTLKIITTHYWFCYYVFYFLYAWVKKGGKTKSLYLKSAIKKELEAEEMFPFSLYLFFTFCSFIRFFSFSHSTLFFLLLYFIL